MTATLPKPFSAQELGAIRAGFPELSRSVRGDTPLVYLDSAATSQRLLAGMDAQRDFAVNHNAAVHRGAHALAEEATVRYESARAAIAGFLGVGRDELVFTAGTTAAINLLTWALSNASAGIGTGHGGAADRRFALGPDDRIVVTQAEHHSNLVPWQHLAARTGAELAWLEVTPEGRLDLSQLPGVVNRATKVVAFTHASNVTGAVTDVPAMVAAARKVGALTVLDAAQTAPHGPLDLASLGVDFAALSAHKMYGPTGVGALYGRFDLLADLPPGATGGSTVEIVTMERATFLPPPNRFEPGTQAVTEVIGWAAVLKWLAALGMDRVAAHEAKLTARLLEGMARLDGIRVLGPTTPSNRLGTVAFAVDGVHPHDAGQYIDSAGIAVRVGHHCAQPVHRALGVNASTRASVGVYNTDGEIDHFLEVLGQVRPYFGAS
jgi:cysteine desulfurase/selenocysteine lyase